MTLETRYNEGLFQEARAVDSGLWVEFLVGHSSGLGTGATDVTSMSFSVPACRWQ